MGEISDFWHHYSFLKRAACFFLFFAKFKFSPFVRSVVQIGTMDGTFLRKKIVSTTTRLMFSLIYRGEERNAIAQVIGIYVKRRK